MFGKSKKKECKEVEVKDESSPLDKAKEISEKYKQLSECCGVLSSIQKPKKTELHQTISSIEFRQGWRVYSFNLRDAGIDIEDVYEYIGKLAQKRKLELECELSKLS